MSTGEAGVGDARPLVIYLMAGADTPALAEAAVAGGADIVEIGFPFSDPLADGPVIRAAAEKALAAGMRTAACLECLAATRALVGDTPLIPMTYASLLEAYGWERFETDARAAGATSFIIADTAAGSRPELQARPARRPHLDRRADRARRLGDGRLALPRHARPARPAHATELSGALAGLAARARALTDVPLYAGFGISTPEQARAAADLTDGIVVGSRAVLVAEEGPDALRRVRRLAARRARRLSARARAGPGCGAACRRAGALCRPCPCRRARPCAVVIVSVEASRAVGVERISSYVTLSPCCCVQNARHLPSLLNGFGFFAPRMPSLPGSPSETWMPVISLSPSFENTSSAG